MTREDVYDKCVERIYPTLEAFRKGVCSEKQLLSREAIDAIIDCAVEEAQKKNTRPCSTCIHYVTKDGHTGCEAWECEYEGNGNDL